MAESSNHKLIDEWFPCSAVDHAVDTAAGSGKNEKAIFTWFASRPVAQARAAVLAALLGDSPQTRADVERAVRDGDADSIQRLRKHLSTLYPEGRPVVLDIFSGRGIIPLEAARFGAVALGVDLSPVATLGGRLLAEFPARDWTKEPALPFARAGNDLFSVTESGLAEPRLLADARSFLAEVGRRVDRAVERYFPANPDGSRPWGYLWAVSISCDGCGGRFPIVGSLALRHPYGRTNDSGQSFRLVTKGKQWRVQVFEGLPDQLPTFRSATSGRGKSAHCPFCKHVHSLEAVKAKGFGGDYQDELLVVADVEGESKKRFRAPRSDEIVAASSVDVGALNTIDGLAAVPDERIPPGNVLTVRATGYGFKTFGRLMVARQAMVFAETARAIRDCGGEVIAAGASKDYALALMGYGAASLIRRLRRATRGARLESRGGPDGTEQNRVYVGDVFSDESKISYNFDYLETGCGGGAGSWESVTDSELDALREVIRISGGTPARLRRASALALPIRDHTVDAVVTDPPYYGMIDYADASDLFYVWLRRIFAGSLPELFAELPVQDKSEEVIVKRSGRDPDHRTEEFYETSLARSFAEARRVLRNDGHLVVVFGHSDPDAWKRLLTALHQAGFVVTSSWPSRTESANTGMASIKVTVSIGCRVAAESRSTATAAQVDREVAEAVKLESKGWSKEGLALTDQLMAAYGPAMEVYGRYERVIQPDGTVAPLERYLTLARTAVRDAMALKLEEIPLETFDALTRFAVFWMRLYGRTNVPKGEARFLAQADNLRLDDVRADLLEESKAGFKLLLGDPGTINAMTPVINVVRAMAAAWQSGGVEAVAATMAMAERTPDDQHVWAIVGDLARQLPQSDSTAKALTALQRNVTTIQKLARGLQASRKQEAEVQELDLTGA